REHLGTQLAYSFGALHRDAIRDADPAIPPGFDNRAGDVWGPLFAIADAYGGDWPHRARAAARALVQHEERDLGEQAVNDTKRVWTARGDPLRLSTHELVAD